MKHRFLLCLATVALAVPAAHAATIFSEDFTGGTGDLNGTSPDTGSVNWVATPSNFLADGTIGGSGAGAATLAFTPASGVGHTLARILRMRGLIGLPRKNDCLSVNGGTN